MCYSKFGKLIGCLSMLLLLIIPGGAFGAAVDDADENVQTYTVHQPSYGFDFEVYRTDDFPDTWFKTYDDYFVTRRFDQNWVYGRQRGSNIINTQILVGSVNPANVRELNPDSYQQPGSGTGRKPSKPPRVFDFESPEPDFVQERAWDQIPWAGGTPPPDKMDFAERIYTTMKDALSSRRNSYMLYGEPLNTMKAWQPSSLFKEVPFPGDWGESIIWTNDKRGILWWTKWHVFGISTYGSKVLGAWILDSGWGYNDHRIRMPHFWKWYDGRILLFNHFFKKEPIYDDEMAVWLLNEQYLFILVPNIDIRVKWHGDMGKMSKFLNPLEWLMLPFSWLDWLLGWRPTDKHLLYYLVRLSDVPDEVTLNQIIRSLRTPLKPEDIHEARDVENADAAEMAQMRRMRQQQE